MSFYLRKCTNRRVRAFQPSPDDCWLALLPRHSVARSTLGWVVLARLSKMTAGKAKAGRVRSSGGTPTRRWCPAKPTAAIGHRRAGIDRRRASRTGGNMGVGRNGICPLARSTSVQFGFAHTARSESRADRPDTWQRPSQMRSRRPVPSFDNGKRHVNVPQLVGLSSISAPSVSGDS